MPTFLNYGKKMLKNDFNGEDGFTLSGGIKDAGHIRRLACVPSRALEIIRWPLSF